MSRRWVLVLLLTLATASRSEAQGADRTLPLSATVREAAIHGVLDALDRQYVFPDVATRMRTAILAQRDSGRYASVTDAAAFAAALTTDPQRVSQDKHLVVGVSTGDARRPVSETSSRHSRRR